MHQNQNLSDVRYRRGGGHLSNPARTELPCSRYLAEFLDQQEATRKERSLIDMLDMSLPRRMLTHMLSKKGSLNDLY